MRFRAYSTKFPTIHQVSWTKSQRDAFYYGYVAGFEMTSRKYGRQVKSDVLGKIETFDLTSLRRKLNYFCLEKRIGSPDRPFYWDGVQVGIDVIEEEQKEKASTLM